MCSSVTQAVPVLTWEPRLLHLVQVCQRLVLPEQSPQHGDPAQSWLQAGAANLPGPAWSQGHQRVPYGLRSPLTPAVGQAPAHP